jgi:hypothetical protein
MYKILKADKDAYITNRFIKIASSGSLRTGSNVGAAGTLDLFKLYGVTFADNNPSFPNLELSRILIHFDLQPIKDLIYSSSININHKTFNCSLKLFDVYGGQTTPSNFDVSIFPMSKSFDEGVGRDVVYYSDYDACNFSSSSIGTSWEMSGSGKGGGAEEVCDYITSSVDLGGTNLEVTQHFSTGEEDLTVDVTKIVSATLAGILPDSGFRLSLKSNLEDDKYSYFVKRFSSRTAYDSTKHPRLIVRYDDSVQDDSQNLRFDQNSTIFLRNYLHGEPANILSGSSLTSITGSNSLLLKLVTAVSGNGSYSLIFTGSQHSDGVNYYPGLYSASFTIPQTNQTLYKELQHSGSVTFTPIWLSLDESVAYFTGSKLTVYPSQRSNSTIDFKNYVVTTSGLQALHRTDEKVFIRLNIFDHTSPTIKLVKRPIELSGVVVRKAYYQVRDISTNEIILSFDETYGSTKVSSDFSGMYFVLDTSNLMKERSYVIDVMLVLGGTKKTFKSVSNVFKISDTQVA